MNRESRLPGDTRSGLHLAYKLLVPPLGQVSCNTMVAVPTRCFILGRDPGPGDIKTDVMIRDVWTSFAARQPVHGARAPPPDRVQCQTAYYRYGSFSCVMKSCGWRHLRDPSPRKIAQASRRRKSSSGGHQGVFIQNDLYADDAHQRRRSSRADEPPTFCGSLSTSS